MAISLFFFMFASIIKHNAYSITNILNNKLNIIKDKCAIKKNPSPETWILLGFYDSVINIPFLFPKLRIQPCSMSNRFLTTSGPKFACCLVPIP